MALCIAQPKQARQGARRAARKGFFEKLFETAEIAKFTAEQIRSYEDSLKYYRQFNTT